MSAKAIFVICDGMGDRPVKEHGYKTPLEAANTPHLDKLAEEGLIGLMDPVSPGVRPGSDVAHLAILGYNPYECYAGRGSLEAAGAGITLKPGDIAFRANFATATEDLTIVDRRAGRIKTGTKELTEALNQIKIESVNDVSIEFYPTIEHRGVLILRGEKLSRNVSDTDPHATGVKPLKSKPLDNSVEAERTAKALNEFTEKSFHMLKNHQVNLNRVKAGEKPANIILSRGAGSYFKLETLQDKYGIKTAAIAGVALVKGVCRIVGMDILNVEGATGGLNTNFNGKADEAAKAIKQYDFVLLHVKATDVAGHDGNFEAKIEAIENIDKMIDRLIKQLDLNETYITVTADHCTPVNFKDHSGDPVPILIHGPEVFHSGIKKFCEKTASQGNLCRIKGADIMAILTNYMGVSKKFGY
ncbi:2,3-bisphosphoglycerate-independent phosphoglycerate mutase [Candidatus Bathyarchaeota archaeon]|nr:2,3-bisphosphoglycerate-independent phosphoglycerate mutase [Candidatus Bathyarchaeota archaeon]